MHKLVIIYVVIHIICVNVYAQTDNIIRQQKVKRILASTDLETILSKSTYANIFYEKEVSRKLSFLYGLELRNSYSSIKINGRVSKLNSLNYYFLKAKSHYYFLSFNNEKQKNLNGLYLGPSFKIGGAKGEKSNYLAVSPGVFFGSCFVLSKRITVNVEFDFDGYWEWKKEIDTNFGYNYRGHMLSYINLWFSLGYRF